MSLCQCSKAKCLLQHHHRMLVEDFEAGVEGASEEAIVPGGEAATSSCSLCLHQQFVYNQEKHLFVCFCKTKLLADTIHQPMKCSSGDFFVT